MNTVKNSELAESRRELVTLGGKHIREASGMPGAKTLDL